MGTRSSERGGRGGRFLLSFLELQIAMVLGASVCYLLGRLIPTSSGLSSSPLSTPMMAVDPTHR